MDTPQIYVACLAAYNNGILHGRWISANQDFYEIQDEIRNMLAKSPIENAEEFALHDYEGFGSIRLSEYEDLETIVKYAEFIAEHGELGAELLADYDFDYAKTLLEDHYHGAYELEVDFAYELFDACYCSNALPENLSYYFDYAAFARDLFINDYIAVNAEGKVHVFSRY